MRDLIDGEAELDDEEEDESFDGDSPRPRRKEADGRADDSSEEDEDDDDEEAARLVIRLPRPLMAVLRRLADTSVLSRSAKASLSTKMRKKTTRRIRTSVNAGRRRSGAVPNARKRSSLTKKISIS